MYLKKTKKYNVLMLFITLILSFLLGCASDSELAPANPLTLKVNAGGTFCSGVNHIETPIKILFVIDISGSNRTSDPAGGENKRLKGYREILDYLVPVVKKEKGIKYSFGLITFTTEAYRKTEGFLTPEFKGDDVWNELYNGSDIVSGQYGLTGEVGWTDYTDATKEVRDFISEDINNAPSKSIVSRTRYIVLFVTDGIPEEGSGYKNAGAYQENICSPDGSNLNKYFPGFLFDSPKCPGDGCQRDYCIGEYGKHVFEEVYAPSLSVRDIIISMTDTSAPNYAFSSSQPAAIRLHTFFYGADYYTELAYDVLEDIAIWGRGMFKDLSNTEFSFLDNGINYGLTTNKYQLLSFFAHNTNRTFNKNGQVVPDSDGDGLDDETELKLGTHVLNKDSDGDGISDGIEVNILGTNPLVFEDLCESPEDKFIDEDGDGLNKCEEFQLGTSDRNFDTDGDTIPDGLEVAYGTNPKRSDRYFDYDYDRINNIDEITSHTNPRHPTNFNDIYKPFQFTLTELEQGKDGQNCYYIKLENLEIIKTLTNENIIKLYALEVTDDSYVQEEEDNQNIENKQDAIFSVGTLKISFDELSDGLYEEKIIINDIEFNALQF